MLDSTTLAFPIIVATVLLLVLVGFVGMLLVVNNTRRIRHRVELAEMKQAQDRAVMDAEREAIRQTLRDLGRELHDNVGQLLAVAQLGMSQAMDERAADPLLEEARNALEQGMEEVRRMGHDLNTELWKSRSLVEAIRAEVQRLQRVARMNVDLQVHGEPVNIEPDTSTVLYRIFQVILANTIKHSRADRVQVRLSSVGASDLELVIGDNGVGFDPATTTAHAGLTNIHDRCALIGYTAQCNTTPGGGCTWHIHPHTTHGS